MNTRCLPLLVTLIVGAVAVHAEGPPPPSTQPSVNALLEEVRQLKAENARLKAKLAELLGPRKEDAIKAGLRDHRLAIGMTLSEATMSVGEGRMLRQDEKSSTYEFREEKLLTATFARRKVRAEMVEGKVSELTYDDWEVKGRIER